MLSAMITPFYAALLAALYIYLSARVIQARRAGQVSIGDGRNRAILRATRVHGNFIEYTPLALLLFAFIEMMGGWWWAVHLLNIAFLIGRIMHAYGLAQEPDNFRFRVWGMIATFVTLGTAAAICAYLSLRLMLGL